MGTVPERPTWKPELGSFLRQNPYANPYTEGLFYREKMRAIHRIAPDRRLDDVLEIGGGRSGLTAMLYPDARVINVDIDLEHAHARFIRDKDMAFVCGNATDLPFPDATFDAVTMFDVLEHVLDDQRAISEAWRLLKDGGVLLVSSPNERWRFPYYERFGRLCPTDTEVMADWGHVRRGYSAAELEQLVGRPAEAKATFINGLTVIGHDLAFSRLPPRVRHGLCSTIAPLSWLGYALHRANGRGTETVYRWRKH